MSKEQNSFNKVIEQIKAQSVSGAPKFAAILVPDDIDVVEVVRCAECKYSLWHKFPFNKEEVIVCYNPPVMPVMLVSPHHFCSHGERKEETDEPNS